MNIFLTIYLVGIAIKMFSFVTSSDEFAPSQMFNEAVLWPWYLLMDIFFGFMSIFTD